MQGQLQFSAKLWPSFGEVLTGPKIQLGGFQEGLLIVGYLRRHGCAAEGGRRGPRSTTAGRVQVADTSTTWPTRQSLPPPSRSPFLDFRSDGDADARADGDGPANSYRLHAGGCEVAAAGWGAAGRGGGGGCRSTACNLGTVLPQLFRVPRRKGIPTTLRQQSGVAVSRWWAAGGPTGQGGHFPEMYSWRSHRHRRAGQETHETQRIPHSFGRSRAGRWAVAEEREH